MPNKFHSLLASKIDDSLLKNLNLSANEERDLLKAANEIRTAITQGFSTLREKIRKEKLDYEIPKPKFAMQGSFVYGTLNAPAYPPKQQVDIDLGVYLPFSALGNGEQPKTATSYYFQAITKILEEHINANRLGQWKLPPEHEQKPTCIRVILNQKTHIDLPLYAVPEGEINRITEDRSFVNKAIALNSEDSMYSIMPNNDAFLLEARALEAVNPDVIHMAHRKDGWKPSDALVIRDWVKAHFNKLGAMIRPVNRFLKAWRDETWRNGGEPSSILLLAHTLRAFPEDTNGLTHCDTLEAVINELPNIFERPLLVPCPTSEDKNAKEDLCKRIPPEKQSEYLQNFRNLKLRYAQAKQISPDPANQVLISLFGSRMPNDPSRIVVERDNEPVIERIKSTEPEVKPLFTTDRSNSG